MRESALGLAPAKAGRQVSWAGENREVLSLAFGLTVPVQRKLPVSVLTVLPKGRLCVTCEMSHLRRCDDEGLPPEHVSLQGPPLVSWGPASDARVRRGATALPNMGIFSLTPFICV